MQRLKEDSASHLLIASARLPVSLVRRAGGEGSGAWEVTESPGGLAVALRSLASERPVTWVGWPGAAVPAAEREEVSSRLERSKGVVPVFLDQNEVVGWYEELSNRLLWPLCHAMPVASRVAADAWEQYVAVNQRFADAIAGRARPGDTVWVHDYQLALVPEMLRRRGLGCSIGFFLHIPFPAAETFRTLPMRAEILSGILGADFIGFHCPEYVTHFKSSSEVILGVRSESDRLVLPGRRVQLGAVPIGIDPDEIEEIARRPEVAAEHLALRERFRGRTVIVGVDRLDYTKGLPRRLAAFEEMLEKDPQLADKVVFIQIASPSRTAVAEYQNLKREVDEIAGRIAGKFGGPTRSPLVYVCQHVPRERLIPLYRLADIALVTPLRDGMNLVCLEYVAARDRAGTLILSEFAGAAPFLPGAVLVNPHDTSQMATTLADAVRRTRTSGASDESFASMRRFVDGNTASVWAERFLARLEASRRSGDRSERPRIHRSMRARVRRARAVERARRVAGR
jgi:trehalose 6-phosphate synthase/phosphatase